MHVFNKCGVLERNYDQTYVDNKQQVLNGGYLELKKSGKDGK